jgi:hypothetical protein
VVATLLGVGAAVAIAGCGGPAFQGGMDAADAGGAGDGDGSRSDSRPISSAGKAGTDGRGGTGGSSSSPHESGEAGAGDVGGESGGPSDYEHGGEGGTAAVPATAGTSSGGQGTSGTMGSSGSASGGTGGGGGEGTTGGSGPSAGTAGQSGEACTPMALAAVLPEKFVWHSFTGTVFTGAGSACTYCSGSPCGECAVTWGAPAWNGEDLVVPIESAECNAAGRSGACGVASGQNPCALQALASSGLVTLVPTSTGDGYTASPQSDVTVVWDGRGCSDYFTDAGVSDAVNVSFREAIRGLVASCN